jgi:hypothetical protein
LSDLIGVFSDSLVLRLIRVVHASGWNDFLAGIRGGRVGDDSGCPAQGCRRDGSILSLIKNENVPIALLEVHLSLTNKNESQTGLPSGTMSCRLLRAAIHRHTTMKAKIPVVLSLLLLAGGSTVSVRAEDKPATPEKPAAPAPKKPVQQQLTGKVIAVDKVSKTITLQVNNLTYVLEIADSTRIAKADKEKGLIDVLVGEEIKVTVLLRELPNGRVEVAVLSVDLAESTEAQGGQGRNGFTQPPPFQNGPNPANVDGPIISPHN